MVSALICGGSLLVVATLYIVTTADEWLVQYIEVPPGMSWRGEFLHRKRLQREKRPNRGSYVLIGMGAAMMIGAALVVLMVQ